MSVNIRLDVRTKNPQNGSQGRTRAGMLARARERRELRACAHRQCIWQAPIMPGVRQSTAYRITLTRIAPRPLDAHDGLRAALKPIVDGVADFFGTKDSDPRLEWHYAPQRKGRVREYAVEIQLEPLAAVKAARES